MLGLVLSYFDGIFGPKILFKAPETLDDESIDEVTKLMSIHEEGFFGYNFGGFQSSNIIYTIFSPYSRGKQQLLLVSLLESDNVKAISKESSRNILEGFIQEFKVIPDVHQNFSTKEEPAKGLPEKLKELEVFFIHYYNSLKPIVDTLKLVEQRYKDLFDSASDSIFLVDYKMDVIIDMNIKAEILLQKPHKLTVGQLFSQVLEITTEEYDLLKNKALDNFAIRNPVPIEGSFQLPGRDAIFVEINASEIRMGGEHIIQYNFHDITFRKKLEQSNEESERKLSLVLENSPDLIVTIDKDNTIQFINHMPPNIDKNEIIGKNAFEFLMFDDENLYQTAFNKVFNTGAPETIDVPGFTGLWYRARFIPITQNAVISTIMLIISNIPAKDQ